MWEVERRRQSRLRAHSTTDTSVGNVSVRAADDTMRYTLPSAAASSEKTDGAVAGHEGESWAIALTASTSTATLASREAEVRSSLVPSSTSYVEVVGEVLRALHYGEQERRTLLRERTDALQRRAAHAEAALRVSPQELQDSHAQRKQRLRDAQEDLRLLQHSLLARPLLSARMWRLLLSERVWVTAVRRCRGANGTPTTASTSAGSRAPSVALLELSLSLARVSFGALGDYIHGAVVSRTAPRFAVSLPSSTWRQRVGTTTTSAPVKAAPSRGAEEEGESDLLFAMMQETALGEGNGDDDDEKPSNAVVAVTRRDVRSAPLRWLPPRSADVLPLVVETLALHVMVVPELSVTTLATNSVHTAELVSLLGTLQKMATVALTLLSAQSAPASSLQQTQRLLHTVLPPLERTLLQSGSAVKRVLVQQARRREDAAQMHPENAARLLLELDALHQLHPNEPDSHAVVSHLVLAMFPELRSNTQEVLLEKSRQSVLLSFATGKHRRHLLRQHGGATDAEGYLQGTSIQQARLRQRMLGAALRERYLTDQHLQRLADFGQAMPMSDLVSLFALLAVHAGQSSTREGAAAGTVLQPTVTASLYVAEAILVSGTLNEPLAAADLVRLCTALAVLSPVVDARREAFAVKAGRHAAGPHRRPTPAAQTETVILSFLVESALEGVNALLAVRLERVAQRRARQSRAMRRGGREGRAAAHADSEEDSPFTVQDLYGLAMAMVEMGNQHSLPELRKRRPGQARLLEGSARLLRDLLCQDTEFLWKQVRALQPESRESFERGMLECFRYAEVLDNATVKALRIASSSSEAL